MVAVMTLWPHLPFDPDETLLSYTGRLSLMHTGRGMERLLADRGIHKEHFISGRADAVAQLAEATGYTVDDLSATPSGCFSGAHPFVARISRRRFSPRVRPAIAPPALPGTDPRSNAVFAYCGGASTSAGATGIHSGWLMLPCGPPPRWPIDARERDTHQKIKEIQGDDRQQSRLQRRTEPVGP